MKEPGIVRLLIAAGLVLAMVLGCSWGSMAQAASAGGLDPDKAARDASDRFPDALIGEKGAPDNTPGSTLGLDKGARDASDRFPDALIGGQGATDIIPGSTLDPDKGARDASDQFPDPFLEKKR